MVPGVIVSHAVLAPDGPGVPLVALHGFSLSGADWLPVLSRLPRRPVFAPDLPNHGSGPLIPPGACSIEATVDALAAWRATPGAGQGVDQIDLLGYSLGGRVALAYTCRFPGSVRRLVLESAMAGLRTEAERADRRAADEELATFLEAHPIGAFVDRWLAQALFDGLRTSDKYEAARAARLGRDPRALAASLRGMGTGSMEPLWERLPGLAVPTLVVAGRFDEKFTALARELVEAIPDATLGLLEAGHTTHHEAPEAFVAELSRFLG